ncbi:hypothetical protein QJS10_CPA01g01912 [Acorus calamus]|uniref:DUF4283 domain-containing protein n=1 Tax=Acorus calamus TaxID=4465 RepID=A0AAV9FFH6_ACOCL|nr:hypothetical protein QJS10_CPA01g01912 [Acorus calamus]
MATVLEGGPWTMDHRPFILRNGLPRLPNLPLHLWEEDSLSRIGSLLGVPLYADSATLRCSRASYARICVEVQASTPLPDSIVVEMAPGIRESLKIDYDWKPHPANSLGLSASPHRNHTRRLATKYGALLGQDYGINSAPLVPDHATQNASQIGIPFLSADALGSSQKIQTRSQTIIGYSQHQDPRLEVQLPSPPPHDSRQATNQSATSEENAALVDPTNQNLLVLEREAKEQYLIMLQRKESFLRQKSRQLWLSEGDRNSKFFYSSIKSRIAKNTIRKVLLADGSSFEDPKFIKEYAVEYYKKLLNTNVTLPISEMNNLIPLSALEGEALCAPVLESEIKQALFSIKPHGSSGPDGFSAHFFQNF